MILEYIFIFFLILISIYDIKHLIIPDTLLFIIFFLALLNGIKDIENVYKSMSIYVFPLFFIWLLGMHINKELIGIGDIKLVIIIGMKIKNENTANLYHYYFITYLIGFVVSIIIIIINKDKKEIPFAPMLCFSYILRGVF